MAWINDIVVEIPDAKRKMLKIIFFILIYRSDFNSLEGITYKWLKLSLLYA